MLASTGRPGQRALLISLHSSTRTAPAVLPHLNISRPAQIFLRFASTRAHTFWTSDDPLIKGLRRRQESYRLRQVGDSARRKAERLEAVQLAKSEIRWIVQHVRKLQAVSSSESSTGKSSKSTLNRASRRALVSMATKMTRENVPISYLLGSVPFGSLAEELTVRPPILLPRLETEHWATEVVTTLLDTLLSFFVPSLAAYQIAYEIWSGQRKVADERDRLAKVVNTELHSGRPGPISDDEWQRLREVARNVQDGVLRTRLDTTRVPEWFYKRFRDDDERDFSDTAEGHRIRLAQNTPPLT